MRAAEAANILRHTTEASITAVERDLSEALGMDATAAKEYTQQEDEEQSDAQCSQTSAEGWTQAGAAQMENFAGVWADPHSEGEKVKPVGLTGPLGQGIVAANTLDKGHRVETEDTNNLKPHHQNNFYTADQVKLLSATPEQDPPGSHGGAPNGQGGAIG